MTETLRDVARAVEQGATGLVAFDPQADAPFLDGGDATAASTFQDVHDSLVSRGIRTGRRAAASAEAAVLATALPLVIRPRVG